MTKPKYSKRHIETITCDVPPFNIMFTVGFSYDEIIKELKKQKCTDWVFALDNDKKLFEDAHHLAISRSVVDVKTDEEHIHYCIYIKDRFQFTDLDMVKLAHEVLHITQYMMDLTGSLKEYEFQAYLHTHIMKRCLEVMRG